MAEYRRRTGSHDTWHWCKNCSNWPESGYQKQYTEPTTGEKCNECKAKTRDGACRS